MTIAVCVKQIPGPDAEPAFDPRTGTFARDEGLVMDESDIYGVELALRLAELTADGEVLAISMAPDQAEEGLRSAFAMGVPRAVLVSDPALAGTDALGTAKVLAAVVSRADASLVVAATESTDGYTGTVPVQMAELLGYPALTFVRSVEIEDDIITVQRQTEEGYDLVSCPLPAVVTVTAGVVEPRYPTLKALMAARTKPIEILTLSDLGIASHEVGAVGARQQVVSIEQLLSRRAGEVITDFGVAHERIIEALKAWGAI